MDDIEKAKLIMVGGVTSSDPVLCKAKFERASQIPVPMTKEGEVDWALVHLLAE